MYKGQLYYMGDIHTQLSLLQRRHHGNIITQGGGGEVGG